jgi:hypothetical protein
LPVTRNCPVWPAEGNQDGEQGDDRQYRDAGGDRADHVAGALPAAGEQRQREHAQVGGDPGDVGEGFLAAFGPGEAERGPGGEGREQAERAPGDGGRVTAGQGPNDYREQQHPPDRDADLVADQRVEAAPFEAEVDREPAAEYPRPGETPVDSAVSGK